MPSKEMTEMGSNRKSSYAHRRVTSYLDDGLAQLAVPVGMILRCKYKIPVPSNLIHSLRQYFNRQILQTLKAHRLVTSYLDEAQLAAPAGMIRGCNHS